ncbi:50S ribosomal protein L2 [Candidatus Woesearchaeota archaeon]|nr:50S ribosomal protein L2 [Candidatus Woesearchaeota archaeon]
MGKNLIQQRRGKGSIYRAPSFNYKGRASHNKINTGDIQGTVTDLLHCKGHSAPLARVRFPDETILMLAPEGICVGDVVMSGKTAEPSLGSIIPLQDIPEGTAVFNLETQPGDGGKLVRASGTFATILAKFENKVLVELPSKKVREFNPRCRACLGKIAGGGRLEKPFVKAGNKYRARRARRKLYPRVNGVSMNSVDHPHGGSSSHHKGRPTIAPANAPPGRKVGMLRPKRTGRKK